MNKHSQATGETFVNHACRDVGHDWQTTTSNSYRKCTRDHCKAVERLVNGQWVNARPERPWTDPRIAWEQKRTTPKQVALF